MVIIIFLCVMSFVLYGTFFMMIERYTSAREEYIEAEAAYVECLSPKEYKRYRYNEAKKAFRSSDGVYMNEITRQRARKDFRG